MRKLKGSRNRKYFTKDDLRHTYDKFNGACAKCGMALMAAGSHKFSADFMLRIPLAVGGKIERENLLVVCKSCKKDKKYKRIYPEDKIEGYNTLADLVAQLTQAVVEEHDEKVLYFRHCVNVAVTNFVQSLQYKPIEGECPETVERYETENTVADIIEELASAFKEIKETKQHVTLRRNK
jgi:molybdopterin converting factor small subunit